MLFIRQPKLRIRDYKLTFVCWETWYFMENFLSFVGCQQSYKLQTVSQSRVLLCMICWIFWIRNCVSTSAMDHLCEQFKKVTGDIYVRNLISYSVQFMLTMFMSCLRFIEAEHFSLVAACALVEAFLSLACSSFRSIVLRTFYYLHKKGKIWQC